MIKLCKIQIKHTIYCINYPYKEIGKNMNSEPKAQKKNEEDTKEK